MNVLLCQGKLDPKKLQLQLTGFLEKSTGMFMEELWGLLVDAQNSLGGIPSAFLQDKKEEMLVVQVHFEFASAWCSTILNNSEMILAGRCRMKQGT